MNPDLDDTITSGARRLDPDVADTILTAGRSRPGAPRPAAKRDAVVPVRPIAAKPAAQAPPRYAFRVGSSERAVLLDAVAFIGRAPSSPRILNGQSPRLIRVPSPQGEVSGTHLEIRQLGSSVVVTDLRSTNGSIVAVPGSLPHTLRQGESMVVSPGTLVDIGDGNVIEILPLQRHGYGDA